MATAFFNMSPYEDAYSLVLTGVTPHPQDLNALSPEKGQSYLPQISFSNDAINSERLQAQEPPQQWVYLTFFVSTFADKDHSVALVYCWISLLICLGVIVIRSSFNIDQSLAIRPSSIQDRVIASG
jgi:hypothetical protein